MSKYVHTIDKIVGRRDDETRVLMTLENGSTIGICTYLFFFSLVRSYSTFCLCAHKEHIFFSFVSRWCCTVAHHHYRCRCL